MPSLVKLSDDDSSASGCDCNERVKLLMAQLREKDLEIRWKNDQIKSLMEENNEKDVQVQELLKENRQLQRRARLWRLAK